MFLIAVVLDANDRRGLHTLRNLKAFDDAPNGCVLPDATALSWVVASVQEVRDRSSRMAG